MIIECVGLPGAGKTTVCEMVSELHGGKGAVPLTAVRPNRVVLEAAWHIFALCLTTRPFDLKRLKRAFNLVLFLRHYEHRDLMILLDQGIVQKVWSILADSAHYSSQRLDRVIASLLPFAPDWVVWLETPPDAATRRLGERVGGNSRYDTLRPDEVLRQFANRQTLLRKLTEQFCNTWRVRLLEIDGTQPAEANAVSIDALFKEQNSQISVLP
jgi:thymidylate kinase